VSTKRDYKPDTTWKKRRRVRRQGFVVVALVLVGLFASLLAYISDDSPSAQLSETSRPVALPPVANTRPLSEPLPSKPADAPAPKYDFYRVLPERELVIRKDELGNQKSAKTRKPALPEQSADTAEDASPKATRNPASTPDRYVIQAGSFRKYADADRLKAALAFMGIKAHIVEGTGKAGGTWHRVRIGPVKGRQEANALRKRLSDNNIPSIALKTK
jgi:cell division protein FtsN